MSDFFEIDFLDIESNKSGDAVPMRYSINGNQRIHITDGGFQATGDKLVTHINTYYDNPSYIDSVLVTHPDGDHAGGLRKLFEEYEIGELWMIRPWLYADELIDRFSRYSSVENLAKRLREIYPNIAALEELAIKSGTVIKEPFQGQVIGEINILAPSKKRYLDLVVESEKTPEATKAEQASLMEAMGGAFRKAINVIRSAWGEEIFPEEDTSPENNMSVIQYANLCGQRVLLTGDAGRAAMNEAADYAPNVGLLLPGIDRIQVPHHGSRHNVSTEVLDRWLGERHSQQPSAGSFTAIVSASKEDDHHPRKSVVRAFIHRGARVITTEGYDKRTGHNAPEREGWVAVEPMPYPEDQED
ncbi:competence protein ComEC [Vibrio tritonius]|uniref:ComEC/Rec2 family competence protein n=1 Tax=Vibrio tritonius TaxID=1435069 RepID=UPI00315C86EA